MRTQRYWQLIGPRGRVPMRTPALIAGCSSSTPPSTAWEAGAATAPMDPPPSFVNSVMLSPRLPSCSLTLASTMTGAAVLSSSSTLGGFNNGLVCSQQRRGVASGAVPPPPPPMPASSSSFGRFAMPPSPPSPTSFAATAGNAAPPPRPPMSATGARPQPHSRTHAFNSAAAAPPPPAPPPGNAAMTTAIPTPTAASATSASDDTDIAAAQPHARPGSVKVSLPRPAAHTVEALAWTQCPQCGERSHVKHLLQHVNQAHPEIDRDHLRRQVREQYANLSAAVKTCWADQASMCGSTADKNRGGVPCRHCPVDATGLPPLFATVDILMRHIGHRHKDVDLDDEEPPQRMSPDMVMKKLDGTLNPPAMIAPKVGATGLDGATTFDSLTGAGGPGAISASDPSRTGAAALPFPCEVCGRNYSDEVSILQHLEEKHPEVVMHPECAICFADELTPPALCVATATRIISQVVGGAAPRDVASMAAARRSGSNDGDSGPDGDAWATPTMAPAISMVRVAGVPAGSSPHQIAAAAAAANYSGSALGSVTANGIPPPPPGSALSGITGMAGGAINVAGLSGPPSGSTTGAAISVTCSLCPGSNKIFTTEVALLAHVKTKHSGVNTVEAVRKMIEENEVRALKCPHCDRVFTSDSALDAHVKGKHQQMLTSDGTTMSLSVANGNNVGSSSSSSGGGAAAASADANVWWCNACNKGFSSGRALHGHLMTKHGLQTQSLPCPACRRTFTDIFSLKEHVTLSHRNLDAAVYESEMYPCDSCGKRFLSSTELDTHTILAHVGNRRSAGAGSSTRRGGGNPVASGAGGVRKPLFGQTF